MALSFMERLRSGPVLCDGAMGTVLYDQGIFINRCYDELNISQPEIIRAIHRDYVHAGAEVIETNTFGANSFRLARHGCADQVAEVNRTGARLARDVAKANSVFVAGLGGALGVRIKAVGKNSRGEGGGDVCGQIMAVTPGGVVGVFFFLKFCVFG